MKPFAIKPASRIKGAIKLPGDKSIAHRAVIISSLSQGGTKIENFPLNVDCLATLEAFRHLGVDIRRKDSSAAVTNLNIYSQGLCGLKKPKGPVFVSDSGTTLRLLLGVLAGQDFSVRLTAGKSLSLRPMRRVCEPLRQMGAQISSRVKGAGSRVEEYPPIITKGSRLKGITYKMPVASAQVKSALILAALYAKGKTSVIETVRTRDHTERMLKLFGAKIFAKGRIVTIEKSGELVSPGKIYVPADISSAAFFIVLAAILKGSTVKILRVGLNPLRAGLIKVLKRMGANIKIDYLKQKNSASEPVADIVVKSAPLKATQIKDKEVPSLIDELPVLMVAASLAKGVTTIEGAQELRVKETDRIRSMSLNLRKMGVSIKTCCRSSSEDIIIKGVAHLSGARINSFNDHRTAMSLIVAASAAKGPSQIDDISCINKSFPDFIRVLNSVVKRG